MVSCATCTKKILNGIYYKAVTIPGGKPFAIVATIVQLFLKATLTTKIMIQAILLPLARTTTFLEFITWPREIWQGKVWILWEDHKIWKNSHFFFKWPSQSLFFQIFVAFSEYLNCKQIFREHCVLKRVFMQTFPGNQNFWSKCNRVIKVWFGLYHVF